MSTITLFVVNPISGDHDKASMVNTIKTWAQSSGQAIEVWETTGENDQEKLKDKIDEIDPGKVISVGGDGTVTLCASLIIDTQILLGIIPSGSANGMGTELRLPSDIEENLKIIEKGSFRVCDILMFNNNVPGLHISDIGLNAGLVKRFEEGERRGFLGYAQGLVAQLQDSEPFKVSVKTENFSLEKECLMLALGNARRYGTGAILNSKGKIDDGLLELSFLKSINLAEIAGHFFEIVNEDSEHMETYQCKKAEIKLSRKVPFQIDGELQVETDTLTVEVVPSCLRIISP